MAKGANYRVQYRRRRENKTDYAARRVLATSNYPRLVVRVSNKQIFVQVIMSRIEGDYVLVNASSHELKNIYDWKANGKNIPAAYLLGYIVGNKAIKAKIGKANLDIGLKRATVGNKLFAVVQGALDAGLEISIDNDVIPSNEAIIGNLIAEYAEKIVDPIEYEKRFSVYLRRGLRPEMLPSHFDEVKKRIEESMIE